MTFILYAAVALVLLGSVFIYTSIEVRKVPGGQAPSPQPSSVDDDLPEVELPSENGGSSAFQTQDSLSVLSPSAAPGVSASVDAQSSFSIVLYTDEKGIVLTDDSSLVRNDAGFYDGFLRVGEGTAEIGADAMNVRIGKKYFRYDFHRIRDIVSRGETAAVYFKGDIKGNIFIAENDMFVKVLVERFSLYSQKG